MKKYTGWEVTAPNYSCDSFTEGTEPRNLPNEVATRVFEVEADCWEEASDAWHRFRHKGGYYPMCPKETCWSNEKFAECPLCHGKSAVNMAVWREYRKEHPEIANHGEGPV